MVVRNGKIFLSLREIEPQSPYSADYLRIRILQKKLRGIKIGREWYTTKEWLEGYLNRYAIRSIQEQFARVADGAPEVASGADATPARLAPPEPETPPETPLNRPVPLAVPQARPSLRGRFSAIPKKFAAVSVAAAVAFVLIYPAAREVLNRAGTFLIEYPAPNIAAFPDELFLALRQAHHSTKSALRPLPDAALRLRSGFSDIRRGLVRAKHAVGLRIAAFAGRVGAFALEAEIPVVSISMPTRALADRLGEFSPVQSIRPVGELARAAAQAVMLGVPQGAENVAVAISIRVGRLAIETEIPALPEIVGGTVAALGRWNRTVEREGERFARGLDGAISTSRLGIAEAGSGITALEQAIDERLPQAAESAISGMNRSVSTIERGIQGQGTAVAGLIFSEIARSAKEALFQFPVRLAELVGLKRLPSSPPPTRLAWQEVEVAPAVAEAPPPPRAGGLASDREVTRVREVVETREVIRTADLTELDRRLNEINAGLRNQVNKLVGDVAALYEGPEAKVSIVRTFAPSQQIDRLSNVTFSGSNSFNLTDVDIPNDISVSGYLGLAGGTLTGTTTFAGITLTSGSAGFGTSTPSNFFSVAGDVYLTGGLGVGTATNSPGGLQTTGMAVIGSNLAVRGTATSTFTGPLEVTGIFTASANTLTISSTSTLTNQLTITRAPITAHTFASWSVGVANSAVTDASLIINPASAASDTNLFGVAINDGARFLVDAEGDIFANSVTLAGGSTLATTTISGNVTIEGNATLGDAPNADSHAIRGAAIVYATTTNAALTIWNSTRAGDLLRLQNGATSPTTEFVFTAAGQAAFGTTTISGTSVLTIGATTTNSIPLTLKGVTGQTGEFFRVLDSADAQLLTVSSAGRLGVGTSTPWGLLSAEHAVSNDSIFPAFVVADTGTATPSFIVLNRNGNVGVATRTPEVAFSVGGVTLTGSSGATSTNIGAGDIRQHLRVGSMESLGDLKAVAGNFSGRITAVNASTTGSASIANLLTVSGAGTSTFSGGLTTGLSLGVGTTAPSSFYATGIAGPLLYGGAGATSTNIGAEDIKTHLRVGSLEIVGACSGCPAGGGGTPGGSDGQVQYNNATAFGGAPNFVFDDSTNRVGIGTTTPGLMFSVGGPTYFDTSFIQYGSSTASTLTFNYLRAATSTIPNNAPYAWTIATSTTADPIIRIDTRAFATSRKATTSITGGFQVEAGAISHDWASGITSFDSIQTGPMAFDTDAGIISWVDMPSATTTAGVALSYSAQIDSTALLTIYSTTSASGIVSTGLVGIASSTPSAALTVRGAGYTVNTFLTYMEDAKSNARFVIRDSGLVGIGTTTPGALLGIKGPFLANSTSTIEGGGLLAQAIAATGTLGFYTGGAAAPQMVIGLGGNVGIGTTSPGARLAVSGEGLFDSTLTASRFQGTSTTASFLNFASTTSFSASNLFTISGAGTSTVSGGLTIATGSGTVGIGSSTPALKLSVAGMVNLNLVDGGSAAVCHTNALTATEGVTLGDCTGAPAQDYAELYPTESDVGFGDIVVAEARATQTRPTAEIGASEISVLAKSSRPYEPAVIGIASNNYGDFTSTGHGTIADADHPLPIALSGRVPVKVSLEGGPIKAGDRITTSSLPGIGMKATTSGPTVGVALAPFEPFSHPEQCEGSPGDSSAASLPQNDAGGCVRKILVFVNLSWSRISSEIASVASGDLAMTGGWSVDPVTGKLATVYGLDLSGQDIANVRAVFSANGAWSIDESGKLVIQEIETGKLSVKEETRVGSASSPRGITLFDFDTGQPNCIFVQGGAVRSVPGECTFTGAGGGSGQDAPPAPDSAEGPPPASPQETLPPAEPAPPPPAPEPQPEPEPLPQPEVAPAPEPEPALQPPPPPSSEPVAEPPPSESAPAASQPI